jgi:hypothetical protein
MIATINIGNKHRHSSKALDETIVRAEGGGGLGRFTTTMLPVQSGLMIMWPRLKNDPCLVKLWELRSPTRFAGLAL